MAIEPVDGFAAARHANNAEKYGHAVWDIALGTSVTEGDICGLGLGGTSGIAPAGNLADAGTEAFNQEALHDDFCGIALESRAGGDNNRTVLLASRGEFIGTCPSSTFDIGAPIGASENGAGNALENQQVEGVATSNLAIGHASRLNLTAATQVYFKIQATRGPDPIAGPQTMM